MHTIRLKDAVAVAMGASRLVFPHPDDANLVIKVVRREAIGNRVHRKRWRWFKTKRRDNQFASFFREVREQFALRTELEEHPPFLQRIVGFAETDLGLGLVVEALRGRDGEYARTLAQVVNTGRFDAAASALLDAFLKEIATSDLIVHDIAMNNIVLAYDERRGDRFVLVDGFGERTLIPINSMSLAINRLNKRRKIRALKRSIANTLELRQPAVAAAVK